MAAPAVKVECYSGGQYAERPRAFEWQGRRYEVAELLHTWRFPDGPGFRVSTTDNQVFELSYRELNDSWEIFPITDNLATGGAD